MNFRTKTWKSVGVIIAGVVLPLAVGAQGFLSGGLLKQVANGTGIPGSAAASPSTLLPIYIGNILNVVLGLLGFILLFYLFYGGYLWMTSGGETDGTKKAKTMISNAIVGLVIITTSVVVTSYIIRRLCEAIVSKGGTCS